MTTLIFSHPDCLEHDTGPSHPESTARLQDLLKELAKPQCSALQWRQAPRADRRQLARAHGFKYISDMLASVPDERRIDADITGTVMSGEANSAFCAVRPPGHHAEPSKSMGFRLFNNVAVGALHGREVHGLRRIAVVDFDVQHGNGTQNIFRADGDLFFGSTHQSFLFPHPQSSNNREEGNIINVGLPRGCRSDAYRHAFAERIEPRLRAFKPDFVFTSAGFDAHRRDPIGDLLLNGGDFTWITERLTTIATECCQGRLVSVLEGGYAPSAVASAGGAHVQALMVA